MKQDPLSQLQKKLAALKVRCRKLADDLQILEMQMGCRYVVSCPAYPRYRVMKEQLSGLETAITSQGGVV